MTEVCGRGRLRTSGTRTEQPLSLHDTLSLGFWSRFAPHSKSGLITASCVFSLSFLFSLRFLFWRGRVRA